VGNPQASAEGVDEAGDLGWGNEGGAHDLPHLLAAGDRHAGITAGKPRFRQLKEIGYGRIMQPGVWVLITMPYAHTKGH